VTPGPLRPATPAIEIAAPGLGDERAFLAAVARSRALHHPWVQPPADSAAFRRWLARSRLAAQESFLVRIREGGDLVGVVNLSEIVRGIFRSAYMGYYAFRPHAGQGLMSEGMRRVITAAFRELDLHRLEANIQPGNTASIRLVERLGFRREGLSPRYLKINGRWRDHERWALLAEEWRPGRSG
jgi:ribosomal-protein-alanine N-acetyltransferase